MAAWLGPAGVWGLSLSRTLSPSGQVARTVASWTFSVQPRCTPRVGVYARSAPSWAFIGARSVNSCRKLASQCVAAVLPLIPPVQHRSWTSVTKA
jgi:hypothetical protein